MIYRTGGMIVGRVSGSMTSRRMQCCRGTGMPAPAHFPDPARKR
jgi:hypothetical protein